MKHTLFFLLLALQISAQEVTKDTSYLTNTGGNFFSVTRIEYSDGAYSENKTLVGDTSAILSLYVNKISNEANQYAAAAVIAMKAQSATAQMAKLDTIISTMLLRSPITSIMESYEREFLQGRWEIQYNGTITDVTFPRLSTNRRIRMLPSGGSARTMLLYGNMMRIVNYPTAGPQTLFKVRDGRWENLARTIVVRRTYTR